MSADLTGYLRAVRLYTERARAIYAAAIEEPYTPPASDEEAIVREPDITMSAQPLGQEDTMNEPKLTAAELRQKHADLQAGLHRLIAERVRAFEAETGLAVYSINVALATLRRGGEPAETVVASVDVRVGLGR